jgi:hypothetical protein
MDIIDPQNASTIALVVLGAQIVGRAIPDSKGGVLGFIRKLAKVIGLYTSNRV